MTAQPNSMTCPKCGAAMNHHAEKLIDPRTLEEAAQINVLLGGALLQLHSCPACGASASRMSA